MVGGGRTSGSWWLEAALVGRGGLRLHQWVVVGGGRTNGSWLTEAALMGRGGWRPHQWVVVD